MKLREGMEGKGREGEGWEGRGRQGEGGEGEGKMRARKYGYIFLTINRYINR